MRRKNDLFIDYFGKPERLINLVESDPGKKIVVIDEVQKLPALLDIVHHSIEEKKGMSSS